MKITNERCNTFRVEFNSIFSLFYASNFMLLLIVLFNHNSMYAQTIIDNNAKHSFYISVFGGLSFEAGNKNLIVESTIEVGGRFFDNNTEERTDYKQSDTYAVGLESLYSLNERFSAGLMFIYKPNFKSEYFVEDIMQDGILGKFKTDLYVLQALFRYTENLSKVFSWNVSIGTGYAFGNTTADFYGTVCGRIGQQFAQIDENDGAVCASVSLGASMNLYGNFYFAAKGMIVKYFGELGKMKSSIVSAGIEYKF